MKKTLTTLLAAASLAGAPLHAAIIDQAATVVGGGGGIELVDAGNVVASNNALYSSETTNPASDWVWTDSGAQSATFSYTFDLTGYDVSTASLSGLWGVDNTGDVFLNGFLIASLPSVTTDNFTSLSSYAASDSTLFNQGMNTLLFVLTDAGGPESFRATAILDAEAAAVPVPAALPLFAAGLVFLRRRAKS
jgi:hypothetical protein